jgi:hypothetical protein
MKIGIITRLPFLKILMEIKFKKFMLNAQTVLKPDKRCIISVQYLTIYFFYVTENQIGKFWHAIVISVGKGKIFTNQQKQTIMKTQTMYFLEPLTRKEIKNLAEDVKEILDHETKKSCNKKFSVVDLWSIHGNKKRFYGRRFL